MARTPRFATRRGGRQPKRHCFRRTLAQNFVLRRPEFVLRRAELLPRRPESKSRGVNEEILVRANSVPRPPSVVEVNECLRSRRAQPGADHLGFSEVGLENACESFGQAGGTEESVERFDGG